MQQKIAYYIKKKFVVTMETAADLYHVNLNYKIIDNEII